MHPSRSLMAAPANPGYKPGIQKWGRVKPDYATYRSPYGPAYTVPKNFGGISPKIALQYGIIGGSFAGVAGLFALFFFSDVPKVRKDIMQRIPIIGEHYVREVPPSDNPF